MHKQIWKTYTFGDILMKLRLSLWIYKCLL